VLVLWLAISHAEPLSGTVVSVVDGDTLTVFSQGTAHRVRLAGVEAPQEGQRYAESSHDHLVRLARGQAATLECHETDHYKRKICKVKVQPASCPTCGHTLDVGLAQIIAGAARWCRACAKELSEEDRGRYESEEVEARKRRRGLWALQ
jgi:endonuclease YncB( thermonuclease family)